MSKHNLPYNPNTKFISILALIILSSSILFFTSCNSVRPEEKEAKTRYMYNFYGTFAIDSGVYYQSMNAFLYFFDYESQQSSLVCTKANCLHRPTVPDMPEELICDAYTWFSPVFVRGSTLYTVTTHGSEYSTITASELDRTNQQELIRQDHSLESFYVYDHLLFYTLKNYILDEEGLSNSGQTTASFHVIDLDTGEDTTLITLDASAVSGIEVAMADDDYLYLKYIIYDEIMTEENMDTLEAQVEYHALSFSTYELTTAFENLWDTLYWFFCKDDTTAYLFHSYRSAASLGELLAYDIASGEMTVIASDVLYERVADNKIIYYRMNEEDFSQPDFNKIEKDGYYYDLDTLESVPFTYYSFYEIVDEDEDHFVIWYTEHEGVEFMLMKKEDYFNGTFDYVPLEVVQ